MGDRLPTEHLSAPLLLILQLNLPLSFPFPSRVLRVRRYSISHAPPYLIDPTDVKEVKRNKNNHYRPGTALTWTLMGSSTVDYHKPGGAWMDQYSDQCQNQITARYVRCRSPHHWQAW